MGEGRLGALHHPWLGALTYLIVRGRSMNERARPGEQQEQAVRRYLQRAASAPNPPSTADELVKLADLRDSGRLPQVEVEQATEQVLGRDRRLAAPHVDQQRIPIG
jgi:hypothetical protein